MRQTESDVAPGALNDLGHLGSGVGHHVINAFSAIVSNAELLRIKAASGPSAIDPAAIADMIIDTALEASTVARRLIDYTRPITTIGQDRVVLDRLVAEYVETRAATPTGSPGRPISTPSRRSWEMPASSSRCSTCSSPTL